MGRGLRLWLVAGLLLAGCANYTQHTALMRQEYAFQRYDRALAELDQSDLREQDRNRLLYLLERAMILDRLGRRDKSRELLLDADRLVEELYTESVTAVASTFLINESMTPYRGEIFEQVAIHTLLALSFIEDEQWPAAQVQARKINTRLHAITDEFGDSNNSYREDAFARFLAGLIYEREGNTDSAIIDYRKALKLYTQNAYRDFYRGPPPAALVRSLYRLAKRRRRTALVKELEKAHPIDCAAVAKEPKGAGYIAVLHEVGRITPKVAEEFMLPIGGQLVRFSFPIIPRRSHWPYRALGLRREGVLHGADNTADLNAIAHRTLEDRRGRLIAKGVARLIAKGVLTGEAYEHFGPLGGLLANAVSAITESADTRSWTLMPEAFYVTRLAVPAGKVTVAVVGADGREDIRVATVKKGELMLWRDAGRPARQPLSQPALAAL